MTRSNKLSERRHRLPLELEARLAAHCAQWGEPSADVIADAVELLLDGFADGVSEDAAAPTPDGPGRVLASAYNPDDYADPALAWTAAKRAVRK